MKLLLIIASSFLLFACSTTRVLRTELAEGTTLTDYKTFDFYKLEASGDTVSVKFKERTSQLQQAIAEQLQSKGYRQETNNPDLLVNIGVVVDEKIQTRETNFATDAPLYIGQRRYSWKSEEKEVDRYKLGTATVHLVDAKQNKMVWEGVVEGVIPDKDRKAEERLREGMAKLFEKFPG
jgi:hypothetical protein